MKTKISFLKLILKKIQSYSVHSLKSIELKKQILFHKKLTIEFIKCLINQLYLILESSDFLTHSIFLKAKQNQ